MAEIADEIGRKGEGEVAQEEHQRLSYYGGRERVVGWQCIRVCGGGGVCCRVGVGRQPNH